MPKIDLIAETPSGGIELVLVEERNWLEPAVLEEIKNRVKEYIYFATSGLLDEHTPGAPGRRVEIRVTHRDPMDEGHRKVLDLLNELSSGDGIRVSAMSFAENRGRGANN